ncbi:hypothetical protein SHI21_13630 [Bacteriovorax sp. PP10]|uniref:Uncharacterized protein n=1 Tax=Bacteriovorax antarcticus TaxID=3088717 RepID=A0ABU5VZ15_9BACT|nr:hypothetical protein [Bacteriovorax sp. PP10]MEA9357260.1 hypothetical protein [Bacteriovorax sp. PP10]
MKKHEDENIETKLIEIFELKNQLENQIKGLQTSSLPWDKYDFLIAFLAGFSGAAADYLIVGGADRKDFKASCSEASTPNFLKDYDLKNNPIDKQIPGASLGDHRLYSYGHDLTRISKAISLMRGNSSEIGIDSVHGILKGTLHPNWNTNISIQQAMIILFLHLYKDFFTSRSLPIPGSTLIAELNGNKMPSWLEDAYIEKEFNLRTITGHTISAVIPEIIIRSYIFIKYYNTNHDREIVNHKRNEILLLSHSIVSGSNLTKSYLAQNPYLINYSEIMRTLSLASNVIIQNTKFTNNLKSKNHLRIADNLLDIKMNDLLMLVAFDKSQILNNSIKKIG